jgi:hypothetical protein
MQDGLLPIVIGGRALIIQRRAIFEGNGNKSLTFHEKQTKLIRLS